MTLDLVWRSLVTLTRVVSTISFWLVLRENERREIEDSKYKQLFPVKSISIKNSIKGKGKSEIGSRVGGCVSVLF